MSGFSNEALEEKKIYLTLLNGTGFVFDVDDYMLLRQRHRILGSLVGTCSTRGWSPNESMLPVELSRCETQLLVEQGIALLVSKREALLRKPSAQELATYKADFDRRVSEQADALKAEKLRETERNIDKVLAGKRKKLLAAGAAPEEIELNADEVLKEIGDSFVFDRKNALLEVHCAHPTPHIAQIIRLPPDKSLKYQVFRDFWLKGKFVTPGEAFGADFLLYPGDPMMYHASHIVILLHEPKIRPLDLIAKTRLSVTVNKICVFAYFAQDQEGEERRLCYQTVQWEGNRDKEKRTSTTND